MIKWMSNLKIGVRIIIGFLLVAIIACAIGGIGVISLQQINGSYKVAYTDSVAALQYVVRIDASFESIRMNLNGMVMVDTQEDKEYYLGKLDENKATIDENIAKYREMLSSYKAEEVATEIGLIDKVQAALIVYGGKRGEFINKFAMDSDLRSQAVELLKDGGELGQFALDVDDAITDLINYNNDYAAAQIDTNGSQAANSTVIMIIVAIIGVLLAILIGLLISRIISKPIGILVKAADKLAVGDMNITEEIHSKDEIGKLAESLKQVIVSLKDMTGDTKMLIQAAIEGKPSTRADASQLKGEYREIVEGVNKIMDALTEPFQDIAAVLGEMSKGNLSARVRKDYKGEYQQMKDTMNETVITLEGYVSDISGILTQITRENLDIAVTADYKGDFVEIKNSLNNIIESLNADMGNINDAANQVAAGSKQISDSSMALSQGTTEQASSVEELTASLEEISSQTKLNAENANQAKNFADNAQSDAVEGNTQMKEMLKAMDDINVSSNNIYKIIKVIDDIAFQTNILALNAAVEAARAGQYGKGFAVVAEEVRTLAGRSANAAKETTDMIEDSIKKAEGGTKIAQDTAEALNKIVTDIEKVSNLVNNIAVASNEQAIGIEQINQGIMQVSQVVQANSATSEESAAASEELSSQAELLKEMVSKFKLKQNTKTYNRLDGLSPDVIRMLEEMSESKKMSSNSKEINVREAAAKEPKIVLSDREFGKY